MRPPHGFRVDAVVATTFTLDLTALLTAPLAFSLLDTLAERKRQPGAKEPELDPYALLRAAREHAERMVVFCDATHIATPPKYRSLFTYLEKSVVEVVAPDEHGVFHPKVWVVKFRNDADEVVYRLLCSSRNLTFDASWDTLLVLNGSLVDRRNAIAANRPLSAFIAQLPGLARSGVTLSQDIKDLVGGVANDLLTVRFELPPGVESLAFHPLGIDGFKRFWPPERIQRSLVVSPFVDANGLKLWSGAGAGHILVSRLDQLDRVEDNALSYFASRFVLGDAAEEPEDCDIEASPSPHVETASVGLHGLHAKLFVVDDGWDAHVFTGSANATGAGFTRNVEFLVELIGKKSILGVDQFVEKGIGPLLQPYNRTEPAQNALQEQLESRLLSLRRQLSRVDWVARVGERFAAGFAFTLHCPKVGWSGEENIQVRPMTLSRQHCQPLGSSPGTVADFGAVSLEALTPFFAFHVQLRAGDEVLNADLGVRARLEGEPADREAQVMAAMLDDPSKVMGFLSMLLSDDSLGWAGLIGDEEVGRIGATAGGVVAPALMERLLRALHARPEQLDSIERVMKDLSQTEAGRTLVPQQLRELWEPIYAARQVSGARS
ncbi:MAG TPA: phospholipase D family protein [Polyangiaceae bacterium]|nr:phospholipase D family protein [Polyangiaceae bacterium]